MKHVEHVKHKQKVIRELKFCGKRSALDYAFITGSVHDNSCVLDRNIDHATQNQTQINDYQEEIIDE